MAACLHYFYMVAFLLMLCEGVHLAILIESAFLHGDVKLPVYLVASWGKFYSIENLKTLCAHRSGHLGEHWKGYYCTLFSFVIITLFSLIKAVTDQHGFFDKFNLYMYRILL